MKNIYEGNEFEALKLRFENQAEQLYRMTIIDLRIFSGFITLQLVFGAWLATKAVALSILLKIGLGIIDFSLAYVAFALIHNNALRRKEVATTVSNCAKALGYKQLGTYLENEAIDAKYELRLWRNYYYLGICMTLVGVFLVLRYAS